MKVLVNDRESEMDRGDWTVALDVIQAVRDSDLMDDEIVDSLLIDGRIVDPGDFNEALISLGISPDEINTVEIAASAVDSVLLQAIEDGLEYLKELKQSVVQVAELFRTTAGPDASEQLADIVSRILTFLELTESMSNFLKLYYDGEKSQKSRILDNVNQFLELTRSIVSSQEEKDWILLADLLDYELIPVIDAWYKKLDEDREVFGISEASEGIIQNSSQPISP